MPLPKLTPQQLTILHLHTWILDLRAPEEFAVKHIPHSINVPLPTLLGNWAITVIPLDVPIVLIIPKEPFPLDVQKTLQTNGYQNLLGYLDWEELNKHDIVFDRLPLLSPRDVMEGIKQQTLYVLDVRTPTEWEAGHIPGALHVELTELANRLEEIPHAQPLAVVCGAGFRAAVAASFLKKAGFHQVANLPGGMKAWLAANLPIIS